MSNSAVEVDTAGPGTGVPALVAQLHAAVASHELAGQATGVLVALHRISPDRAWEMLRRASQHHNIRVTRLARAIVALAAGADAVCDHEARDLALAHLLPARQRNRQAEARPSRPGGSPRDRALLGAARDRLAEERDRAADDRDTHAAARDRRAEHTGEPASATTGRMAAAADRRNAHTDRHASAVERTLAAEDREAAAE